MQTKLCLTQKELARRWAISHRTLERWRWTGEGPDYLKLGGRVIYRASDLYSGDHLHTVNEHIEIT